MLRTIWSVGSFSFAKWVPPKGAIFYYEQDDIPTQRSVDQRSERLISFPSAWQSSLVDNVANVYDMPALTVSLNQCGHEWQACTLWHWWSLTLRSRWNPWWCSGGILLAGRHWLYCIVVFLEDGKYSAVAFMDAFKAVCADSVGCLLPRLLIYCCCISSLQTTYFLLHCQDAGFCLDQGFLKIFDHFFSLVFTRLASSWASLFSSSISHFFFFKSAASFLLWMWSAWKASPTHSWCWTR